MATPHRKQNLTRSSLIEDFEIKDSLFLFKEAFTPLSRLPGSKTPLTTLGKPPCTSAAFDAAYEQLVRRLLPSISAHLRQLEGLDLGVENNRELAKAISRLLSRFGCSLICPHCQAPALALRYSKSGNATAPVFKYRHHSTSHGATKSVGPLNVWLGRPDTKYFPEIYSLT